MQKYLIMAAVAFVVIVIVSRVAPLKTIATGS
jgi:hypothetical protein